MDFEAKFKADFEEATRDKDTVVTALMEHVRDVYCIGGSEGSTIERAEQIYDFIATGRLDIDTLKGIFSEGWSFSDYWVGELIGIYKEG